MAEETITNVTPTEGTPAEERPWQYVRVNPGDTVYSMAEKYGRSAEDIIDYNKLNPDFLLVGQWIWV